MCQHKNYIFNKIKPVILFVFEYKCVYCNYFSLKNHVHHLDHVHHNNDPFNLVCVCVNCHKLIHSNTKFKKPELIQPQKDILNRLRCLLCDYI